MRLQVENLWVACAFRFSSLVCLSCFIFVLNIYKYILFYRAEDYQRLGVSSCGRHTRHASRTPHKGRLSKFFSIVFEDGDAQ